MGASDVKGFSTMTTELTRPISRRIGDIVVTMREDGVELRGFRKRYSVLVSYEEIAKRGLMRYGVRLTERQWANPLAQLRKLSRLLKSQRIQVG
jgi:hypothetical protein